MTETKRPPGRPKLEAYDKEGNLKPLEKDESVDLTPVSAMEEMQAQLKVLQAQVDRANPKARAPDGKWITNYDAKHMRVHGGVEVRQDWSNEPPHPPASIPMYVAEGGGTTDHLEIAYQEYYKFDTVGNPVMNEDGTQQFVKAPRSKRALRDVEGNPVMTEEYKYWIHIRQTGDRLDGDVMSDIAAGKGLPEGAITASAPDLTTVGVVEA